MSDHKTIAVRLDTELGDQLEMVAEMLGVPQISLIREAITEKLSSVDVRDKVAAYRKDLQGQYDRQMARLERIERS